MNARELYASLPKALSVETIITRFQDLLKRIPPEAQAEYFKYLFPKGQTRAVYIRLHALRSEMEREGYWNHQNFQDPPSCPFTPIDPGSSRMTALVAALIRASIVTPSPASTPRVSSPLRRNAMLPEPSPKEDPESGAPAKTTRGGEDRPVARSSCGDAGPQVPPIFTTTPTVDPDAV
ncbi:hypothetical protein SAICODRAFT_5140 [Saitoella complicata NRRL Y-17804]|nr:uncharacterized protein SAICODRAFT_5140 [Saitoella complicata NRRL Y-17804]ODQ55925.1 hypothetical protein SAICODRAFT_5140 [Saitoella complicata NRRL Y-17804]